MKTVMVLTALLASSCTPPADNRQATKTDQAAAPSFATYDGVPDLDAVLGADLPPPVKAGGFPYPKCGGEFGSLSKYVGGDPWTFMKEPAVRTRMARLMGPYLPRLDADLVVASPVGEMGCELVVEGNARHAGGEHNAILSFDMYSGVTTIAILARGHLFVVATPTPRRDALNYSHLPAHVRDWIYVAADGLHSRSRPPPGLLRLEPQGK